MLQRKSSLSAALQPARPADLEALLPLLREYRAYDGHDCDESLTRRALADLLDDSNKGLAWFIFEDREIIGYAVVCFGFSLECGGRDAFLDEFFLREPCRGRGVGRRILAEIERQARGAGCRALHLQVVSGNARAERLYRSAGYAEQGRITLSKKLNM